MNNKLSACIAESYAGSESCLFQSPGELHLAPDNVVMPAELMQHPVMLLCVRFPQELFVCVCEEVQRKGRRVITVH